MKSENSFNRQFLKMALLQTKTQLLFPDKEKYLDSLSLDLSAGESEYRYFANNIFRFAKSFYYLSIQKQLKNKPIRILDLGAYRIYQPEIKKIFPSAELYFVGRDFNLEKEKLKHDDEKFDLVLLWDVIQYFYSDPMFAMSEINRVLKSRGLIFITTPNLVSWVGLLKLLNKESPYTDGKYRLPIGTPRHVHEYAPDALDNLLFDSGFNGTVWTENLYLADSSNLAHQYLKNIGVNLEQREDTILAIAGKISGVVYKYPKRIYHPV